MNGGYGAAVRFRPARLDAADIPANLMCRFRCEGMVVGPLAVIDLSAAGFGAAADPELSLPPGTVLESFELLIRDQLLWSGEAVVVHGNPERVGARFTSGLLDLQHLHLSANLDGRLAISRECRTRLPAEWRSAVGDVAQLFEDVRREIDQLEQTEAREPERGEIEKSQLFSGFRSRWQAAFFEVLSDLHEKSRGFDEETAALGRAYASSMLLAFAVTSPFHRRAYEKPLGYAGDYRMMELCFAEPSGDGLFGRFFDSVIKSSPLNRSVVAREAVMREAVRVAVTAEGTAPVRVLALAAGPALELRRLLGEIETIRRPVELILLDQDRAAHESAHRHLTRVLLEQHRGMLPVTVHCVHSSVRQLLKPKTTEDLEVVTETLANLDLVYSAGLYDYLPQPVAASLTGLLYGLLRPGGRLLLGNLTESAESTWFMDYVLDWRLLYRTEEALLALADKLSPAPARSTVVRDAGRCFFLDVRRSNAI